MKIGMTFCAGLLVAASAFADEMTAENRIDVNVTEFYQDTSSRKMVIKYTLNQAAQIWFDVMTNGVSIGQSKLLTVTGDVTWDSSQTIQPTAAGATHTITWNARKDWEGEVLDNVTVKVLAVHPGDAAPWSRYLIFDLVNKTVSGRQLPPDGGWTDEYKTNKLVMRKIDPGTFWRHRRRDVNSTRYTATITKLEYMAIFECTVKQFKLIHGGTITGFGSRADNYAARPINNGFTPETGLRGNGWPMNETVPADTFIGKLRAFFGGDYGFDLPTEAEWQYAALAGEENAEFFWGTNTTTSDEDKLYFQQVNNAEIAVGSVRPNKWGIYDMVGGVREAVLNWFVADLEYASNNVTDPVGPLSTDDKADGHFLTMGGSYWGKPISLRVPNAVGNNWLDTGNSSDYSFRLAIRK